MKQKIGYGLLGLLVWAIVAFVIGRYVLHLHPLQYWGVTWGAAAIGGWSAFTYEKRDE